jgi:hypothetical protein
MITRRSILFALLGGLFILSGCAWLGSYGSLGRPDDRMTIDRLHENWRDYRVHYGGLSLSSPSALLFEIKGDRRLALHRNWSEIRSREELDTVIGWLNANPNFRSYLMAVRGPDSHVYGYIYTSYTYVYLKEEDEKTLYVGDLPLPPFEHGPGRTSGTN